MPAFKTSANKKAGANSQTASASAATRSRRQRELTALAQRLLRSIGAQPLPGVWNARYQIGMLCNDGAAVLVVIDRPDRVTDLAVLKTALRRRTGWSGEWDQVWVIGWQFARSIGVDILELGSEYLQVFAVAPDWFGQTKNLPSTAMSLAEQASALTRRQLTLQPISRTQLTAEHDELLVVTIDQYQLLGLDPVRLDENQRQLLAHSLRKSPLALIAYWEIDADYDGAQFNPVWRSDTGMQSSNSRDNELTDEEFAQIDDSIPTQPAVRLPLPKPRASSSLQAALTLSYQAQPRVVAVRVIDHFGGDAMVVMQAEFGVKRPVK